MRFRPTWLSSFPVLVAGLIGCGGGGGGGKASCDPAENTGCEKALVCEAVAGGRGICAMPVILRGHVIALADATAIAGARVVALDVNGAPRSSVAVTDEGGAFELQVPHERNEDGTPLPLVVTLRADASGFQTFPSGIRQSLPIDTTAVEAADGAYVLQGVPTEIGLIALPEGAGSASISGTVSLPEGRPGVLVVAEKDGRGRSAVADRDGHYRIFNLGAGNYTVTGYSRGTSFEAKSATVAEGSDLLLDLMPSGAATATVAGKVSIVNPGDGRATSIVLVLESLFDETTLRGESPPGLRAPDQGQAPNVTGAFSIDGVPAGRYAILAAFENDFLVRDPDTSIAGTEIVRQTITAGQVLSLAVSFKVTGAINFRPPLGFAPLAVSAAPTISWEDDSSEDAYELEVYNALGDRVWNHAEPGYSGADPSVVYDGPLDPGMYYQVKVRSLKDGVPISQTEDLAGVFYME